MAELLLVLGMHRSGTSAFARAMRVFGGELGSHLLPPATDNPKGFYEDEELQQINDEFLLSQCAHWDSLHIPNLTALPDATIQEYQERVWSVLQTKFPTEGFFVFKDPRMCRLWPLWVDLLKKYEVTVRILWVLRNPVAVAESLLQRDSMPLLVGLLLWNLHNRSLLGALRHWPHYSTVSYESLLHNPGEVLAQIGDDLKMQPVSASLITDFVEGFLDRNLNHASTEGPTLGSGLQEIMNMCNQQYLIGQDANTPLTDKQLLFSELGENGSLYIESMDFFARQRDELQLHTHNLNLERQRTEEFIVSLKENLEAKEREHQRTEDLVASLKDSLIHKQQESQDYRSRALYLESLIIAGRIPPGTRSNNPWN